MPGFHEWLERGLDAVAHHVLVPLDRAVLKDHSPRYVSEIERLNASDRTGIEAHQLARLRVVCAAAAQGSPLYRERFSEAGIDDPAAVTFESLRRLAPLSRGDFRDRGDDIRHRDHPWDSLRPSRSGGSTSPPVPFYLTPDSYHRRQAATMAFNRWFGYEPGDRIAYLWGAARDFAVGWRWKLRARFVSRARFLPSLPLDDAILDRYIDGLSRFRPRLLQGYPHPLAILSRRLLETGRTLDIPAVSCTAEPLFPEQAEVIERAFGVPPFNWYGVREGGRVATECRERDGLHINAHGVYLEIESRGDEDGPGEVLFTDLWNTGFPIIRYAIGDLATVTREPCPCGSHLPRIERLIGRSGDVFVNSRGQLLPPAGLRVKLLEATETILGIQLVQHDFTEFSAKLVPAEGLSQEEAERLVKRELESFVEEPVTVRIELVRSIPREASGKTRITIREFPLDRPAPNAP